MISGNKKAKTPKNPPQPSLVREGEANNPPDKGDIGGLNYIPYKQKLVSKARELRKEMTEAEKKLWFEVLRDSWKTGYKFTRQKPLGEFIADFYSAKLLLVIEVDGDSHAESKERDQERTNYLKNKYNIEVIRYQNEDVLNNLESVYNDLVKKLSVRFIVINNPPDKGDTGGYE